MSEVLSPASRPESPVKKAAAAAAAAAGAAAGHTKQLLTLGPAAMHKHLLYMRPYPHEQAYFEQLESLDLVNCIIAPMFFANALSIWHWTGLSLVYCVVLLIKGYQLGLLLLPGARRKHKYRRARFYLILAERVLRQFVATPALGRSPRFTGWMRQLQATSSPPLLIMKILVLISGVTISFWNAFCLPLDFVSQVLVNGIFFCIHFFPIAPQVATAMAMLTAQRRHLVWAQWGLEQACLSLLRLLLAGRGGSRWLLQATVHVAAAAEGLPVGIAARVSTDAGGSSSSSTCPEQQLLSSRWISNSTGGGGSGGSSSIWTVGAAAVAVRPRNAPDVDSVAGRLILALSSAHMLLWVLIVPLYLAWRLERHLKGKYLATLMPACQQQGVGKQQLQQQPGCKAACFEQPEESDAAAAAGGADWGSDSGCDADASGAKSITASCCDDGSDGGSPPPSTQQQEQPQQQRWDLLTQQTGVWLQRQKQQLLLQHGSSFVSPPVAHAFIPPAGQLLQHLAVAAAVSLVLAELFVGVCVLSPRVRGLLHQQVLEATWPVARV